MAKTDWTINDEVEPVDMNEIGQEINQLREDVDNIHIPPATLTEAGIVQLSSATDSTSEAMAATPKAVKLAYDRAEQAFQSASNGKELIASAVTGKGVAASGSDSFPVLADKISKISTASELYINNNNENKVPMDSGVNFKSVDLFTIPASKNGVTIYSISASNWYYTNSFMIYASASLTQANIVQSGNIKINIIFTDINGLKFSVMSLTIAVDAGQSYALASLCIALLQLNRLTGDLGARVATPDNDVTGNRGSYSKSLTLPSNFNLNGEIKVSVEVSKTYGASVNNTGNLQINWRTQNAKILTY